MTQFFKGVTTIVQMLPSDHKTHPKFESIFPCKKVNLSNKIRMLRNPLFHPTFVFKRMWTQRSHNNDDPKLDLHLNEYLHPSLAQASRYLEYCVKRMNFATETVLATYGQDILTKHVILQRFADCVIGIYVTTAVMGRASRSYCIGLRNADMDVTIANIIAYNTKNEVQKLILDIVNGPYRTHDENYSNISKRVFESGKYPFEHPLEKNY